MKNKLYITALLTSPVIAFYGAIPFYFFDKLSLADVTMLLGGLTFNILIAWAILIFIDNRFPNIHPVLLFIASYLSNLIVRLLIFVVIEILQLPKPPVLDNQVVYPILTSFAVNAILIVILRSIITTQQKADADKLIQELKLQNTRAEKQVLMQQLQPHFLFNSLSILKSLISENPVKAENYVVKLSEFLRYSVQSTNVAVIELEKELQFVNDYIALQKERFENAFEHEIHINNALEGEIPTMALQALVENIFKHNYFTKQKPLYFSIVFESDFIVVQNTKTSLKLTSRTQTGLTNLNKRYELIANKQIEVIASETHFTVKIPIL